MSKAIEHIRNICKTQTVPEDEYKWIDPVLELSDSIEKETINRRRDTLDLLSTIAGVEERFAASIKALNDSIKYLSDRLDDMDSRMNMVDSNTTEMFREAEALTERVTELEKARDTITIPKYVRYEEHPRHRPTELETKQTQHFIFLDEQLRNIQEHLAELESRLSRQRMCDCEYLGICSDDPAKGDYCPLRKDKPKLNPKLNVWVDKDGVHHPSNKHIGPVLAEYCTCCGAAWYPREVDAEGKAKVVCEECGKEKP